MIRKFIKCLFAWLIFIASAAVIMFLAGADWAEFTPKDKGFLILLGNVFTYTIISKD